MIYKVINVINKLNVWIIDKAHTYDWKRKYMVDGNS